MTEEERKNKKEILDRLDILNEKFNEELETTKRSQDITSFREKTQQRIQVVNSKFNSLRSGVYERLELQMSETKQNHKEMSKKLHDYKKEVESTFDNIRSETINLRQELIVNSFYVLEEKLEAKINEIVDSRLGQFESCFDQLSTKITAVCGTYCQPSVGNELNRVHDTNERHTRTIPTFVPSTMSQSQGKCRCDNNNDNNKHSVNGRARAETKLGVSEITYKIM